MASRWLLTAPVAPLTFANTNCFAAAANSGKIWLKAWLKSAPVVIFAKASPRFEFELNAVNAGPNAAA